MLNELEKAHVYIEQLHNRLQQQEQTIDNLTERLEALENTAADQYFCTSGLRHPRIIRSERADLFLRAHPYVPVIYPARI